MMNRNTAKPELVLASASPRRAELLRQVGVHFIQQPVDVDESVLPDEIPENYVSRLAEEKAKEAFDEETGLPALGSDTTVVIDGRPMGKPKDEAHFVSMLMSLSGNSHQVLTAVSVVKGQHLSSRLSNTTVVFDTLSEEMIRAYWRTGEPQDKAGGYAIQGLGAVFVKSIVGSYSGVVGLPLAETRELLDEFGIGYWQ